MGVMEGFWSERCMRAEQDVDRMAMLLERLIRRTNFPDRDHREAIELLRDWHANRDRRYVALPAGPTKIGNLSSGGIDL